MCAFWCFCWDCLQPCQCPRKHPLEAQRCNRGNAQYIPEGEVIRGWRGVSIFKGHCGILCFYSNFGNAELIPKEVEDVGQNSNTWDQDWALFRKLLLYSWNPVRVYNCYLLTKSSTFPLYFFPFCCVKYVCFLCLLFLKPWSIEANEVLFWSHFPRTLFNVGR